MTADPAKAETPQDRDTPAAAPPLSASAARPAVVFPALMVSVVVVVLAAGGVVATKDAWLPLLRGPQVQVPPDVSPRIAALETRLKALEDRPVASSPTPASAPAINTPPAIDKTQLDELTRRLAESESRAADLVQSLTRRLAVVEGARAQHARADATTQALILAVGQVRAQASAGLPFVGEWDALKALAVERADIAPSVEAIAAIAVTGAPTAAELRRRFETVARAIAIAARAGGGANWVDRLQARLFALVAIRRTDGGAAEGTPDALTLAAENALIAGDVAQAAAVVEKLSGPPAAAAQEWLGQARARVVLDAGLAELHARAVAALAGGG